MNEPSRTMGMSREWLFTVQKTKSVQWCAPVSTTDPIDPFESDRSEPTYTHTHDSDGGGQGKRANHWPPACAFEAAEAESRPICCKPSRGLIPATPSFPIVSRPS